MSFSTLPKKLNLKSVNGAKSPTYRFIEQQDEVNKEQNDFLINEASKHPLKRSRILLHDQNSLKHQMYIVKINNCEESIMPSQYKRKDIKVIDGEFLITLADNDKSFILRKGQSFTFDKDTHYNFLVVSDILIINETIEHISA